ncbi:MAG: isoleucyl-tRNA synthetase, partial [Parcubacteria group bacterium Gr01-1014_56]
FYYMHVIGVALFGKLSFLNVVSTGNILAVDGSKMSKSKGNYTDPLVVMDQFGADALRLYLMGSVVMSGEDFNFKDEDVREAHNRVVGILWNSYKFFQLYAHEWDGATVASKSTHALDQWILSLLGKTTAQVTLAMDAYDTPSASKALRLFVEDYSTWYVRRSRDRVKGDDEVDKQYALATQREVLLTLAQLFAPIMPFIAEAMYLGIEGDKESVHLTDWPVALAVDEKLLSEMALGREVASRALEAREKAGIKVRQPLSVLKTTYLLSEAVGAIVAAEINVKEIIEDAALAQDIELDITITDALREEGVVRGLARRVQEWRKEQGLTISDRPSYSLLVSGEEKDLAHKYRKEIMKEAGLSHLDISDE